MAATQLTVYNDALSFLGEKPITSLTSFREVRRVLDTLYDDVKSYCLEQGIWNFALKVVTLTGTANTAVWGRLYLFTKPADLVHLFVVADGSEGIVRYITNYVDNGPYLSADVGGLYTSYVSNATPSYGGDLSVWPRSYAMYVSAVLASWACMRITGNPQIFKVCQEREALFYERSRFERVTLPPGKLPLNQHARTLSHSSLVSADPLPFDRVEKKSA